MTTSSSRSLQDVFVLVELSYSMFEHVGPRPGSPLLLTSINVLARRRVPAHYCWLIHSSKLDAFWAAGRMIRNKVL